MKFKTTYRQIIKYTSLLGGVQIFNVLMSIIRNKCAAYFIGPWGMGLADTYAKTADLVGNTTNFGIAFSAVRRLSELSKRGSRNAVAMYVKLIRSWTLLTALLGFLVCLVFSPLLSLQLFGDFHTTKGLVLLSPTIPALTLLGGEMAILKGLHELRKMASASALSALACMVLTVVLYWVLGVHGILPVLLATAVATLAITLCFTTRLFPYRVGLRSMKLLRRGGHMIRLGSAFIMAGILGSGAEILVRVFIQRTASLHAVGLYAAGFTLVVSYARMVFVAMDADYFPRLSAAGDNVAERNDIINKQIDVLVMLMAPFLIVFSLCLPLLVRLLYTEEFMLVVPMALCAASYMYFKAVYAPVSYLALARGDSVIYFLMEALYDAVFVALVCVGYYFRGLVGAGLALSAANFFDLLAISTAYSWRYGFRFQADTLKRAAIHFSLLAVSLLACVQTELWLRIAVCGLAAAISLRLSWNMMSREANILAGLRSRIANIRHQMGRKEDEQ